VLSGWVAGAPLAQGDLGQILVRQRAAQAGEEERVGQLADLRDLIEEHELEGRAVMLQAVGVRLQVVEPQRRAARELPELARLTLAGRRVVQPLLGRLHEAALLREGGERAADHQRLVSRNVHVHQGRCEEADRLARADRATPEEFFAGIAEDCPLFV
jgi:hypothetical protein